METTHLISLQEFCERYQIAPKFLSALQEYDLIEIIIIEEEYFLKATELHHVEKMIRLHYDLDINLEGIDAIHHLLRQVESLNQQINVLNNKLRFYEDLED